MAPLVRTFGAARMAVGGLSWVAPRASAGAFGIDPETHPIVTQLFGVRDFALGFLTATTAGEVRRQVLRVGVAIDVADTVASIRQIRAGTMSHQSIALVAAGAALFATIGAVALAEEDAEPLAP